MEGGGTPFKKIKKNSKHLMNAGGVEVLSGKSLKVSNEELDFGKLLHLPHIYPVSTLKQIQTRP